MHAHKHEALAAAGPEAARLVLNAAIAHHVHVDDVVREAISRGPRPASARAALASLPTSVRVALTKLAWPFDCPICTDAVAALSSCKGGHSQCERCAQGECPICQVAGRVLAERNARIAAEAAERLAALKS